MGLVRVYTRWDGQDEIGLVLRVAMSAEPDGVNDSVQVGINDVHQEEVFEKAPPTTGFMGIDESSHVPRPLLCASLMATLIYWLLFVYSQAVHQHRGCSWEVVVLCVFRV